MSLKAGGVGLNLTAASHVFLMVHFHLCFSDDHFYFYFFFFFQIHGNLPFILIILLYFICRILGGILL